MKTFKLLIMIMLIGFSASLVAQESDRFVRQYDYVSDYNLDDDTWEEWVEARNTVVFNSNKGEHTIFSHSGNKIILYIVENSEDGKIDNMSYQEQNCITSDGVEVTLRLFKNKVLLISWGTIIQKLSPLEKDVNTY